MRETRHLTIRRNPWVICLPFYHLFRRWWGLVTEYCSKPPKNLPQIDLRLENLVSLPVFDLSALQQINWDKDSYDFPFFEDEDFRVWATSSGEWGGSFWFEEKSTGIEFACSALSPFMVNKINQDYFLSVRFCQSEGMSLIKVSEPKELKKNGNRKRLLNHEGYLGEFESSSRKGCKLLMDDWHCSPVFCFEHEGTFFQVVSFRKTTWVTTLGKWGLRKCFKLAPFKIYADSLHLSKSSAPIAIINVHNHQGKGILVWNSGTFVLLWTEKP